MRSSKGLLAGALLLATTVAAFADSLPVGQGTSPWVVNTPAPFSGVVTQGTSPWVVNTPPPFSGSVTQGTSPWVVSGSVGTNSYSTTNGLMPTTSCDHTAAINISTATTTAVIPVSATNSIYVCNYMVQVISGTLPSFKWEYGTGGTCGGATVVISGIFGGIAGAIGEIYAHGSGTGTVFITANSNGLCIVSGGTTPNIQGYINYALY